MKWWHWLVLELLITFGVIAWIYFFPSEIEQDFAKGLIGFVLIYAIEEYKNINRRKTMDYKEGMTCGECLKYVFCPVANHNANHKACMKITTKEYHTIEQNTGENQIEGRTFERSQTVVKDPEFNDFKKQLTSLLNRYGYDNVCETPDYILAEYLEKCLINFSAAMTMNINWHTDWKRLGEKKTEIVKDKSIKPVDK